ncbi:MarR family winged helix-turn-helix transcriptional regulator [Paractinoplanes globisporus]|uniref:MarR family winged helix-turn-helix transcriptional regulator n=1 Tax=Paractinoplanes globisporus TaxID=113565 RepID=A0ABW6WH19_9ACTN|nr:MarR family winged helix-turn-helix transcriptional regulator [Actinoplanes globisporus]
MIADPRDNLGGHPPAETDELLRQVAVLCRASNHLRRYLEHRVLREARLTWAGYDVLQLVTGRRSIESRTIAEITGLARATVNLTLKDLNTRLLIRRLPRADDHRYWLLQPTAAGLHLARTLRTDLAEALTELLERPTDPPLRDTVAALHRISRP